MLMLWRRVFSPHAPEPLKKRNCRTALLGLMAGSVALLALAEAAALPVRLVYNVAPSAPLGFYWMSNPFSLPRGKLFLMRLPPAWRNRAAVRGYIGGNAHYN